MDSNGDWNNVLLGLDGNTAGMTSGTTAPPGAPGATTTTTTTTVTSGAQLPLVPPAVSSVESIPPPAPNTNTLPAAASVAHPNPPLGTGPALLVLPPERLVPIANVTRIMKKALPNASNKSSKEAREAMQACVSEFIAYVTKEASAKATEEKRRTITGTDIVWALDNLGFSYSTPLHDYLTRYRAAHKSND